MFMIDMNIYALQSRDYTIYTATIFFTVLYLNVWEHSHHSHLIFQPSFFIIVNLHVCSMGAKFENGLSSIPVYGKFPGLE